MGRKSKAVMEVLDKIQNKENRTPELEELTVSLLREFGGLNGFCKEVIKIFKDQNTSAMVRAKIVQDVLWLTRFTATNVEHPDLQELSTEDLEQTAIDLVNDILVKNGKETIAKPAPDFDQQTVI